MHASWLRIGLNHPYAFNRGMKRGEIFQLTWGNVNLSQKYVESADYESGGWRIVNAIIGCQLRLSAIAWKSWRRTPIARGRWFWVTRLGMNPATCCSAHSNILRVAS